MPVIMNGDHLEFERENANIPPEQRPDWPLPSFDAQDWARAFCDVCIERGFRPEEAVDQEWITTWFANALMRGYDEHASRCKSRSKRTIASRGKGRPAA
jgi:hypothetical protein